LDPKIFHFMPQNGSKIFEMVFWNQFSKLGLAVKMAMEVDSSNLFHLESMKIDEKLYDDQIKIMVNNSLKTILLQTINMSKYK
jgi:hypothetical protein